MHIALAELQVPFEEEIIDLSVPRTPEYLRVNPRGLVPTMEYDGEVLTESAVVAGFLADTFPSALLPASSTPGGPLTRAKIAFFVDTYFSKAHGLLMSIMSAKSDGEAKNLADEFVNVLAKELDPLLADAKPFFGGSPKLTLAEVRLTISPSPPLLSSCHAIAALPACVSYVVCCLPPEWLFGRRV